MLFQMSESKLFTPDTRDDTTAVQSLRRFVTWPRVIAASTAFIGVATILLQLLGVVIHRTYLSAWGVSADQFPKPLDWLLINGYYGIWNGTAMLLLATIKNLSWVAISALALTLYIRLLLSSWNPFSITESAWAKKLPGWLKTLVSLAATSTGIVFFLFFILSLVFTLIGVPAKAGRAIGQEYVRIHSSDFAKRCEQSRAMCVELRKNDASIGVGYLLDISATHVAYLDLAHDIARVIPREQVEIRSTRPAKLEDSSFK